MGLHADELRFSVCFPNEILDMRDIVLPRIDDDEDLAAKDSLPILRESGTGERSAGQASHETACASTERRKQRNGCASKN